MLIPVSWLNNYVEIDWSAEEIAEQLTNIGLEVEDLHYAGKAADHIVYGNVLQVVKHPNADRLQVCTVDVGDRRVEIVCGAPNVAVGQTVTLALPGAVLPGDFEITARSLRGVASEGMICSERELGISDEHEGILVHDTDYTPGAPYRFADSDGDAVLDIDIFPNRSDCMSILGIAREVAAVAGVPLKRPAVQVEECEESIDDALSLRIRDKVNCPRYAARIVKDVTIKPSPDWMQQHLSAAGIRPINNMVDITNYVLLETGQPLHAFDLSLVRKERISVRCAKPGEKITTLDDIERTLDDQMLLICDGKSPVAVAGVMGSSNSGIMDTTTDIVIESAHFRPENIRRTSRVLGLSTEASRRFERGVDPQGVLYAADRAAELMRTLGGGRILCGLIDRNYVSSRPRKVKLRPKRVNALLGADIPAEKMAQILEGLECPVIGKSNFNVTIPSFRFDLEREADLIEEIGRYYGYDNIESRTTAPVSLVNPIVTTYFDQLRKIRGIFTGLGMQEALNASFDAGKPGIFQNPESQPVRVTNPLTEDLACLRSSLLPGLIDTVQRNLNHGQKNVRMFEIGHVFHPASEVDGTPSEEESIVGIIQGNTQSPHWSAEVKSIDLFDVKGIIEAFFRNISLDNYEFNQYATPDVPTGCEIRLRGVTIGHAAMLTPKQIDIPAGTQCGLFELQLQPILQHLMERQVTFMPVSRYPRVLRDLALVLPVQHLAGAVIDTIRKQAGETLRLLDVFDVYQGAPIPAGQKSLGFRLEFGADERTMTEQEVDGIMDRILGEMRQTFGAVLREQ
jgi:phenylalanyl-tRNA synthetase beta chain